MRNREIGRRQVGRIRKRVNEWRVRIADNLAVAVIFHHYHEYVVQMRDACGYRSFYGKSRARHRRNRQAER